MLQPRHPHIAARPQYAINHLTCFLARVSTSLNYKRQRSSVSLASGKLESREGLLSHIGTLILNSSQYLGASFCLLLKHDVYYNFCRRVTRPSTCPRSTLATQCSSSNGGMSHLGVIFLSRNDSVKDGRANLRTRTPSIVERGGWLVHVKSESAELPPPVQTHAPAIPCSSKVCCSSRSRCQACKIWLSSLPSRVRAFF